MIVCSLVVCSLRRSALDEGRINPICRGPDRRNTGRHGEYILYEAVTRQSVHGTICSKPIQGKSKGLAAGVDVGHKVQFTSSRRHRIYGSVWQRMVELLKWDVEALSVLFALRGPRGYRWVLLKFRQLRDSDLRLVPHRR